MKISMREIKVGSKIKKKAWSVGDRVQHKGKYQDKGTIIKIKGGLITVQFDGGELRILDTKDVNDNFKRC